MEKEKILKKELQQIQFALQACGNYSGIKFAYAVAKNIKLVEAELKKIMEVLEPSDEFKKYEGERVAKVKEMCDHDKDGNPVIEGDNYKFSDKKRRAEFDKFMFALTKKYEKTLKERDEQIAEYNSSLNEPIDFDVFYINKKDLPENITAQHLSGIMNLVVDYEAAQC